MAGTSMSPQRISPFIWSSIKVMVITYGILSSIQRQMSLVDCETKLENVGDILEALGYQVEEHETESADGYPIYLTRVTNTLIKQQARDSRQPIVFVAGAFSGGSQFVANAHTAHARPQDFYAHINATSESLDNLNSKLGTDPSACSLPTLALNFGHDCWFVHKRNSRPPYANCKRRKRLWPEPSISALSGSFKLQEDHNSNEVDDCWGYSIDEQAAFDVPGAIEYVLLTHKENSASLTAKETTTPYEVHYSKKVVLVSHSTGGALVLMALALNESLSRKISKAIFWSPTFGLPFENRLVAHEPLAEKLAHASYSGPIPPYNKHNKLNGLIAEHICSEAPNDNLLCGSLEKLGSFLSSGFWKNLFTPNKRTILQLGEKWEPAQVAPISAREYLHYRQSTIKNHPHMFDFEDEEANLKAYNHREAPIYDFSKIQLKQITLWACANDHLATPIDIALIGRELKAAHKFFLIHKWAKEFDHFGYFDHADTARLAIIPTLRDIASATAT